MARGCDALEHFVLQLCGSRRALHAVSFAGARDASLPGPAWPAWLVLRLDVWAISAILRQPGRSNLTEESRAGRIVRLEHNSRMHISVARVSSVTRIYDGGGSGRKPLLSRFDVDVE